MTPVSKLMIRKDELIFLGPGVEELLVNIEKEKSVKGAAEKMGMSYSKAWVIIRNAEKGAAAELVTRTHGGAGGGASELTAKGRDLLNRYIAYRNEAEKLLEDCFRRHFDE